MNIKRIEPGVRMSQAVVANGFVFLAGQVASDTSQDVAGQTRQVLAEIDRLLEMAGSDKSKLVSANVYLPNISDFAAMNGVWDKWVAKDALPARATVEAALAAPVYLVEIQVVAVI
jgi:enamine deaminase RidA (YjgF/YER057c/UK114 family)